jgi:hypothetical protein
MSKLLAVLGIGVLILFLVILGPFVTIWAANTLFPSLNIGYTWQTWVAVLVIGAFIRTEVKIKK